MKNKKIVTNYACYCSTTMLTSKIIKETIENCFNSIVINHRIPMILLLKRRLCPRCPSFEKSGGNATAFRRPAHRYQQSLSRSITCQDVCAQQSHAAAAKCLISSLEVNVRRFVAMLLFHNKDQQ